MNLVGNFYYTDAEFCKFSANSDDKCKQPNERTVYSSLFNLTKMFVPLCVSRIRIVANRQLPGAGFFLQFITHGALISVLFVGHVNKFECINKYVAYFAILGIFKAVPYFP